jgi:hypothetical protein
MRRAAPRADDDEADDDNDVETPGGYVCMYVCTCVYIYECVCKCVRMYVCMYVYMSV